MSRILLFIIQPIKWFFFQGQEHQLPTITLTLTIEWALERIERALGIARIGSLKSTRSMGLDIMEPTPRYFLRWFGWVGLLEGFHIFIFPSDADPRTLRPRSSQDLLILPLKSHWLFGSSIGNPTHTRWCIHRSFFSMPYVIKHKAPLKSLDLSKIAPFVKPGLRVSWFRDPCRWEFLSLQPPKPEMSNSNVFSKGCLPNGIFTFSGFQTSRLQKSRCKAPSSSTSKTPKWSTRFDFVYFMKTGHLSTQILSISDVDSHHLSFFSAFGNWTSLRLPFP